LFYLGLRAVFSGGANTISFNDLSKKPISAAGVYRQGILVDILNPKAAIFFMAFLPQFTRPGMGSFPVQIIVLGVLVVLIGILIEGCIIILASKAASMLIKKAAIAKWLERIMGSILIGLGIQLVLSTYKE
jgi:threonine/homoserine/homoserine lactone efflux protein